MAEIHGKHHICDVCGQIIFLKDITGFSADSKFEKPPEGWTNSDDFGDMCPDCTKRFSRFVVGMFGLEKVPEKWREF